MKSLLVFLLASVVMTSSSASEDSSGNKLFIAKITYSDGPLEHPVVVIADRMNAAAAAIFDAVSTLEVTEIIISEWPFADGVSIGLEPSDREKTVRVNRDLSWSTGLALRPTTPLDPTSSGDAKATSPGVDRARVILPATDGVIYGYLKADGPGIPAGEAGQETHERRQLEDLKSLPNGGRGSGHSSGGPG